MCSLEKRETLKKKHLSKEAIRKIKYKQIMWKTCRHTGNEDDYAIYKEAFNKLQLKLEIQREAMKKICF